MALRWPTTVTAKEKTSRQKKKTHGKRKNLMAKRKRLTAKEKTSQQKKKPHCKKKRLTAKEKKPPSPYALFYAVRTLLFLSPWGYFFRRESFTWISRIMTCALITYQVLSLHSVYRSYTCRSLDIVNSLVLILDNGICCKLLYLGCICLQEGIIEQRMSHYTLGWVAGCACVLWSYWERHNHCSSYVSFSFCGFTSVLVFSLFLAKSYSSVVAATSLRNWRP